MLLALIFSERDAVQLHLLPNLGLDDFVSLL